MTDHPASWTRRQTIAALGAGWTLAHVGGAGRATAATPDIAPYVEPELQPFLPALKQAAAEPPLSQATLAMARKGIEKWYTPPAASPAWRTQSVARADGSALRLYVINDSPGAAKPAVLHTHGGGYVLGEARLDIVRLQELARAIDCVIVTVDYRLAPETDWRGSTADTYAGLHWLYDNAAALGVDRARIAVMGESAGGGHAALLAQQAQDRGEIALCAQILVYPMLDDRTGATRTPAFPIGAIGWTSASNRFGWSSFLGQRPGTASVPAAAVPARRRSLAGLPRTFIGVGGIDLFVDEDIDYARRLIDAGVPTDLVVVPGAPHGFDMMAPQSAVARRFTAAKVQALAAAFGQPAPATG